MAIATTTIIDRDVVGSRLVRRAPITFDATWEALVGEAITPASVELSEIKWITVDGNPSLDDAALVGAYIADQTIDSPLIFVILEDGTVNADDDLSSTTVDITVYGV